MLLFDSIPCSMALKCSALYLAQYRCTSSHLLASGDGTNSASIIGDVYIHPSAKVHSTAKVILFFSPHACSFHYMALMVQSPLYDVVLMW